MIFTLTQKYHKEQEKHKDNLIKDVTTLASTTSGLSVDLQTVTVMLGTPRIDNRTAHQTKETKREYTFQRTKTFGHNTGDRIDVHSRYVFPLAYIVFICTYAFWFSL